MFFFANVLSFTTNKLSPPGFSPRCFHWAWKTKKLKILNPQKDRGACMHVSFPNIRNVWQKQKPWKWPRWWFKYSWFSPLLGEMMQFDYIYIYIYIQYLSDGFKPPSSHDVLLWRRCEFMCLALLCVISALCTLHFSWTSLGSRLWQRWLTCCNVFVVISYFGAIYLQYSIVVCLVFPW